MATIRPFKGLRFVPSSGHNLADIVAPPYDVISAEERSAFAGQDPYNVVRLTLPEQEPDDRSKYIKYARSASRLEEWRREGVLQPEPNASFYRYTQTFLVPGSAVSFTRTCLVTTIKVEPYSKNVILPHEQTFPKHKEDRLRILEATRSHLECIFGLYEDVDRFLHQLVVSAPATQIAQLTTDEDGICHVLERIDDLPALTALVGAMASKKVWIADGHHRYETALGYRESLGDKLNLIPEDFMMMALCSISDPGLVLLPTHRILKRMPVDGEGLKTLLQEHFRVTRVPNANLMETIEKVGTKTPRRAFGVALPGGYGLVAEIDDIHSLVDQLEGTGGLELKSLDVSILHGFIFAKLLGLTGLDFFGYTRIAQEALDAVADGSSPAAFLMNPPTVDNMKAIGANGEFMPQKSTYYYPKLLSGLVMWSLKDFEG